MTFQWLIEGILLVRLFNFTSGLKNVFNIRQVFASENIKVIQRDKESLESDQNDKMNKKNLFFQSVVACFGVVGDAWAIFMIYGPTIPRRFKKLFVSLAVADILYLLIAEIIWSVPVLCPQVLVRKIFKKQEEKNFQGGEVVSDP